MNAPDAAPRLVLQVSAHHTLLGAPDGQPWTLPVGTASLWPFSASGPSAIAVENGIQTVEDAIERVAGQVPRGAVLLADRETLAPLQRHGAIAALAQGAIGLDDIEREYQWLAARAVGAPSARHTVLDDATGDALVLILRELMHHLAVVSIRPAD